MRRFVYLLLLPVLLAGCNRPEGSIPLPRPARGETIVDTSGFGRVWNAVWSTYATEELHTMMVVKDGKVVYERYMTGFDASTPKILWSASKSFTSTAIGLAVGDGLLSVDDKVVSFFSKEELPDTCSTWLQQLTVKNLLTMSSGFAKDHVARCLSDEDFDWARTILATEQVFEPGTRFAYNSMNSYLLSVIFSRVAGEDVSSALERRIFKPLGIRSAKWTYSPQGIFTGGWGLFLSTEDLAKMGLLYARDGVWNGERLLPEGWVAEASAAQIPQSPDGINEEEDWAAGYGYQIWRCRHGFRMDGAHGQLVMVMPEKDAVVVLTGFYTAHIGMNAVWDYVYPNL